MMDIQTVIHVHFRCRQCQQNIQAAFDTERMINIHCPHCNHGYTMMKPTIEEEILFDWKKEAVYQKVRAEKTEQDNMELMILIIKVIELLTWRDEGNGHIRAIETLRQWLLLNGVPKTLIELFDAKSPDGSSPTAYRK
ncbi:hypothetical protein [Paenibacillus faecalis]|uniref:hypothetical protein n=1 Tax=Paenibacillus faecalis TaxID=2079532 RepID=UPI001F17749C|nr:hypothetical protein [Paenibacillus faecalis]